VSAKLINYLNKDTKTTLEALDDDEALPSDFNNKVYQSIHDPMSFLKNETTSALNTQLNQTNSSTKITKNNSNIQPSNTTFDNADNICFNMAPEVFNKDDEENIIKEKPEKQKPRRSYLNKDILIKNPIFNELSHRQVEKLTVEEIYQHIKMLTQFDQQQLLKMLSPERVNPETTSEEDPEYMYKYDDFSFFKA